MKVAVIGAGWAGMAAAVEATQAGHNVAVFEASRTIGGRARSIDGHLPDGRRLRLDNGQHILIGAYTETLRQLQTVGVDTSNALHSLPLTLLFPEGRGLRFPPWPTPWDALAGVLTARGWNTLDKWSVLRAIVRWQGQGFYCTAPTSVAQLCQGLSPRVMTELIEPLCVSALNTPAPRACAQVFLRVLRDALFGVPGGSRLLLPRVDLSALFPHAAARWLGERGGHIHLGTRVHSLACIGDQWQVGADRFDAVIVATTSHDAIRLLETTAQALSQTYKLDFLSWTQIARKLEFEAITTVYAWAPEAGLPYPMLALRSQDTALSELAPAQFVFDRGQLGGPSGLLAFVISASRGDRGTLQGQVLDQARRQLGLNLQAVQTVIEKRATFACTPALQRPAQAIAPGLLACGDYVAGPYPATLEGALRSATQAATALSAQTGAR